MRTQLPQTAAQPLPSPGIPGEGREGVQSNYARRPKSAKHPCARHGVTVVYLALILLVLIGLVGLAVDTGYVFLTAHQLQNAADAAALAGADQVVTDTAQAITEARNTASSNSAAHVSITLDAGDVTVGFYNRSTKTFTTGGPTYNAVKVIARRTTGSANGPLELIFGKMFGVTTADVSRQAIAINTVPAAGLILLSPSASPALQLTGTGSDPKKDDLNNDKVQVNNGAVVIDSNSSTAVQWTGQPKVLAAEMDIVGTDTDASTVLDSGTANPNSPTVPDPLASLAVPDKGTTQASPNKGPVTYLPGYYPNGITAGGTLTAGIYYVENGIALDGNDTLTGSGVMIYLASGGINLKGTTTIDISPPTDGIYKGISYFEARDNSSPIELRGTSGQSDTGTMYFPAGDVTIHGTPTSFANQLIANTLTVAGDAKLVINYDGRNINNRYKAYLIQ